MKLTGSMQGIPFGVLNTADNNLGAANLGAVVNTNDGGQFVLCLSGASALAAGVLLQAAPIVANHVGRTLAAAVAAGAMSVDVPLGATAATAQQYAGGRLEVVDGTGAGQVFGIVGNGAAASSGTLTVQLEQGVGVALDTTSVVSLIPNLYAGVIINPATATSLPIGATVAAVAAGTYFWAAKKGAIALLNDGGTAVGLGLTPSASVAGAVKTATATGAQVGRTIEAGVDTKKRTAYISL